jgi:hypothetical protein
MILEHNTIVNRVISKTVQRLALGQNPAESPAFDHKNDVIPSSDPGAEHLLAFRDSIEQHLEKLTSLPSLRGTARSRYSLFGDFDAHQWHCMFGLHLQLQLQQAFFVASQSDRKKDD